ncbi:MAG TPA: macrolide ABC transporter permease/ATP-binding protein MacB, partial [Beijerinckiaceae bacterium]|nr:macrolide ABC transporter permease/ATP-binding protein MacB [Beijerinckiaceae bacterium]
PSIILADEPTGALDSRTGLSILALFQSLNRAGRTIVMVTHDDHVARHARRVLRLQDGAIIADEPVAEPIDAMAVMSLEEAVRGAARREAVPA